MPINTLQKSAIVGVSLSLLLSAPADAAKSTDSTVYLREIELMRPDLLAQTRQTCALGEMPAIKARIDADKDLQRFDAPFPNVDGYCLKVLTISRSTGHMNDLYINLALQAQGYGEFDTADFMKLLKNNETGRTMLAILTAAKAGQTSYTSITGKPHDLPCALALDAGMTWAVSTPSAPAPVALSVADAATAIRTCYAPGTTTITLNGTAVPASKAGLLLGVWLARN